MDGVGELDEQGELDLWGTARSERGARQAADDPLGTAEAAEGGRLIDGVFTAPELARPFATNLPDVSAHARSPNSPLESHAEALVRWSTWGYAEPEGVRSIWRTLGRIGFERGRVLEPGAGGGAFTAMAPPGVEMTRVEMLQVNARRETLLYPEADVRWESFVASAFPEGHFDAVVGSFPWGGVHISNPRNKDIDPRTTRVDDPRHRYGHDISEHSLIKSLRLTRPGGVVAAITSRHMLDSEDPRARLEMGELADLIGAVRMPDGWDFRTSGRAGPSDVVLFRRREPGVEPVPRTWENVRTIQLDGHTARTNEYFLEHPGHVIGELSVHVSSYGTAQWIEVHGDLDRAPGQLADALENIASTARRQGRAFGYSRGTDRTTGDGGGHRLAGGEDAGIADRGDLWDSYRAALAALGDQRCAELFRSVAARRDQLEGGLDETSSAAIRDLASQALNRLDCVAARTAWDLECAQRTAREKSSEAKTLAQQKEAEVRRSSSGPDRDHASALLSMWRGEVERHDSHFARAAETLQQLREEGRDPDVWMNRDGPAVARWVATERVRAREMTSPARTYEHPAAGRLIPTGGREPGLDAGM